MQGIHILYLRIYFSYSISIFKRYQNQKLSKQLDFLKHRQRYLEILLSIGKKYYDSRLWSSRMLTRNFK